jgi:hypothetical protein
MLCVMLLGAGAPSHAESDTARSFDGEIERWVFSGAFEVGIFGHTGKGNIAGTDLNGPRVSPLNINAGDQPGTLVVQPAASRQEVMSALVGGTFEVMSPRIADVATHPRLFLDANVSAVLTNDVGLARDADPGELGLPSPLNANQILGERAVVGRGTKITVQHQGPQFHAGLGAALTFDFDDQRIRVKPSFVYSRIIMDIDAVAKRAVRLNGNNGGTNPPRTYDNTYRSIELADNIREVYHGIGPALEIEYETQNRVGPFAVTLFLKGHASHLLGDLKTRFQKTNTDPSTSGETVFFKYSQDRWVYRASTGIRFRLVPKRKR